MHRAKYWRTSFQSLAAVSRLGWVVVLIAVGGLTLAPSNGEASTYEEFVYDDYLDLVEEDLTQYDLELPPLVPPERPVVEPIPAEPASSVGWLTGGFAVTPSGAATYSVPLSVPPGRKAMAPSLALTYSSQAGNGILGYGWRLSGFSRIHRCGRSYAQDGVLDSVRMEPNDSLCLDGQRLVPVKGDHGIEGTEYRTERDQIAKVVISRALDFGRGLSDIVEFTVYLKSGNVRHYSWADLNWRQKDEWHLQRVVDRFGNYIEYDYKRRYFRPDEGDDELIEVVPSQISYTGHEPDDSAEGEDGQRQLIFRYDQRRNDRIYGYRSGMRKYRVDRLRAIEIHVQGKRTSEYRFDYAYSPDTGRSRLTSVSECTGSTTCKAPTYFGWSGGSEPFTRSGESWIGRYYDGPRLGGYSEKRSEAEYEATFDGTPNHFKVLDLNGDGFSDMFFRKDGQWQALLSTGLGTSNLAFDSPLTLSVSGLGKSWEQTIHVLDFDNDGDEEILLLPGNTSDWKVIDLGLGAGAPVLTLADTGLKRPRPAGGDGPEVERLVRLFDFNGDGLRDILFCEEGSPNEAYRPDYDEWPDTSVKYDYDYVYLYALNTGVAGFDAPVLSEIPCTTSDRWTDVNGDGAVELLIPPASGLANHMMQTVSYTPAGTVVRDNGPQWLGPLEALTPYAGVARTFNAGVRFLDFNGDGLRDQVAPVRWHNGSLQAGAWLSINTGAGFESFEYTLSIDSNGQTIHEHFYPSDFVNAHVLDYNGDGREDLLVPYIHNPGPVNTTTTWDKILGYGEQYEYRRCIPGHAYEGSCEWVVLQASSETDRTYFAELVFTGIPYVKKINDEPHDPDPMFPISRVMDQNGDGQPDFVHQLSGGSLSVLRTNGHQPDLLERVREGVLGVAPGSPDWETLWSYEIEYEPLTNAEVYTHDNDCESYQRCVIGPQYVASAHSKFTGQGRPPLRYLHRYEGGVRDRFGRGFLGFRRNVTVEENRGAVSERTSFPFLKNSAHQYPFVGLAAKQEFTVPDNGTEIVTTKTTAPVYRMLNGGRSYFVFAAKEEHKRVENVVSGPRQGQQTVLEHVVVSREDVDDFKNTGVQTTTSGNQSFIRKEIFTIDVHAWLVGRPEWVSLSFANSSEQRNQTFHYSYTPGTTAPKAVTRDPGAFASEVRSEFEWDRYGNVVKVTVSDVAGQRRVQEFVYEPTEAIFVEHERNPAFHWTTHRREPTNGLPLVRWDPNDVTSRWGYDSFGRHVVVERPDGTTVRHSRRRLSGGAVELGLKDSRGPEMSQVLDRIGQPVLVIRRGFSSPSSTRRVYTQYEYDEWGRIVSRSLPFEALAAPGAVETDYSPSGRMVTATYADGSTATRMAFGREEVRFDRNGNRAVAVRDVSGAIVKTEDAEGGATTYGYGPLGNVTSVTDDHGNVTRYRYDNWGRLEEWQDPDRGHTTYLWDAFDQLQAVTDAAQQTVDYSYDSLGRKREAQDSTGVTHWEYDSAPNGIGKLAQTTSADGHSVFYRYDSLGRLRERTHAVGSDQMPFRYSYDDLGRLELIQYPNSFGSSFYTRYRYNISGRMEAVERHPSGQVLWELESVNPAGQALQYEHGNGVVTRRDYDPMTSRLKRIDSYDSSGSPLQAVSYQWDAGGNLIARWDERTEALERFRYDRLDRLRNVWGCEPPSGATEFQDVSEMPVYYDGEEFSGGEYLDTPPDGCEATLAVEYDSIGNITYKSDVGSYFYESSRPHAVTAAGSVTFGYDAKGNQETNFNGYSQYTPFNKPRLIGSSSGQLWFEYDASQRRVLKSDGERLTVYGGKLYRKKVPESSASGETIHEYLVHAAGEVVATVRRAQPAGGTSIEETVRYLHRDQLGSVTLVTDETGQGVDRRSYDAFGRPRDPYWAHRYTPVTGVFEPNLGFTGHEHDAEHDLGLINMRGREYDPRLGRFLSPDPLTQAPYFSQSWNRYNYVFNNPLRFTDPSGYQAEDQSDLDAATQLQIQAEAVKNAPYVACVGYFGPECTDRGAAEGANPAGDSASENSGSRTSAFGEGSTTEHDGVGGAVGGTASAPVAGNRGMASQNDEWADHLLEHMQNAFGGGAGLRGDELIEQLNYMALSAMAVPYVGDYGALLLSAGLFVYNPSWDSFSDLGLDAAGAILPLVGAMGTLNRMEKASGWLDFWKYDLGPADPSSRLEGPWSINDLKQGALGKSPGGLGKPHLHHGDQMPGSGIHEVPAEAHTKNTSDLHRNKYNQGVTGEMRARDRELHWWYRAREMGLDDVLPGWVYDD